MLSDSFVLCMGCKPTTIKATSVLSISSLFKSALQYIAKNTFIVLTGVQVLVSWCNFNVQPNISPPEFCDMRTKYTGSQLNCLYHLETVSCKNTLVLLTSKFTSSVLCLLICSLEMCFSHLVGWYQYLKAKGMQ